MSNSIANLLEEDDLTHEESAKFFDLAIDKLLKPNHLSHFWGDRLLSLDKSMGFLSDSTFMSAYKKIAGSHQYDQYNSPHTIAWRLHTLVWAAKNALYLEGDFVECGVFKGDLSWCVAENLNFSTLDKTFYLYDTFNGFDEKYSSTEDFPESAGFLDYANSFYKDSSLFKVVCHKFEKYPNVKVIKGCVPDILHTIAPEKISYLHIDLNSPLAEVEALKFLFPRLVSGGYLIFDDYGWKLFRKQKEAEDILMGEFGYTILELPTGQGLVVKR